MNSETTGIMIIGLISAGIGAYSAINGEMVVSGLFWIVTALFYITRILNEKLT